MRKILRTAVMAAGLAVFAALLASLPAWAQSAPTRIRGQIEKVEGNALIIKARDGSQLTVQLAENARVMALVKASLADVKPNAYIGVTAMPEANGVNKAIAIHIFMESQRGTGEGSRPWDLQPGSTMTNANVESTVAGVDGQTITVRYKDGEKKVVVLPTTPIVAYTPGERSEIKAGAQVIISNAVKQADGSYQAVRVNVGRGVTPPM